MIFFIKHKIVFAFIICVILISIGYGINTNFGFGLQLKKSKNEIENKIHPIEKELNFLMDKIAEEYPKEKSESYFANTLWEKASKSDQFFIVYYIESIPYFWTNNLVIPNNLDKFSDENTNFYKLENGYYEIIKKEIKPGHILLGLIPIYSKYEINNRYFEDGFLFNNIDLNNVLIVNEKLSQKQIIVKDYKNRALFSISPNIINPSLSKTSGNLFQLLGFIILLYCISLIVNYLAISKNILPLAIGTIILSFMVIELIVQHTNICPITKSSGLFLPSIFASSIYGNSLGILLFRLIMLLWIIIIINKWLKLNNEHFIRLNKKSFLASFLKQIIFLFIFFVIIGMTKSLVLDSVIAFDFYNFNNFNIFSLIGLLAFCFESLILLIVSKILFLNYKQKTFWILLPFTIFFSLLISYKINLVSNICHLLIIGIWIILFILTLNFDSEIFKGKSRIKFIRQIISLSLLAFIISFIIIVNNEEKDREKTKYTLKEIDSQRDLGEEFSFIESSKKINSDNFISNYFDNPYISNIDLEQRITKEYLYFFTNKYDYYIHAFGADGRPIKGTSQKSIEDLNAFNSKTEKIIIADNFYYFPTEVGGCKYLLNFNFEKNGRKLGTMFIEIFPKFFGSNSIYPELLNPGKISTETKFENQSFALYKKDKLVSQIGDFEYNTYFNFTVNEKSDFDLVISNGFEHMIYNINQKHLIISKKSPSFFSNLSTFSYIFFFLLFFNLILEYSDINKEKGNKIIKTQVTLQSKIQGSMILLVIFSLIIVGIVTIYFFQNQYKNYHNNRLFKKVDVVVKDLGYLFNSANKDSGSINFQSIIEQNIKQITEIHSVDLNVFNENGNLLISSQPDIFKRGLISNKINAEAYYNLQIENKSKYFHNEEIGNLQFLSAYQPFKSLDGKVLGYLNFPYYGREKNLKEDISYFLIAIINVYLLMILATAILAIILSRSITSSLFLITENLKQVQFGKINVPIKWESKDEIGQLILEYNRMIKELETSAELLTKSEREFAWREMAKQVAHEIKNPLTPMKLSIQHLQRALIEKRADIGELTQKVTNRLIEQIDILSDIASAFSDFAKMPSDNFSSVDLTQIIKSCADLFNNPDINEILMTFPNETAFVYGDKNQLTRVFNNIIKNAIQAIPDDKKGLIEISLTKEDKDYKILIKDNGIGISNDKIDSIFVPNFTTKTSGSGLGLAMSKNIIEKIGGQIKFTSKEKIGTIFEIKIPIPIDL